MTHAELHQLPVAQKLLELLPDFEDTKDWSGCSTDFRPNIDYRKQFGPVYVHATLRLQDDGGDPYPVVDLTASLKPAEYADPAPIAEVFSIYPHRHDKLEQLMYWAIDTVQAVPFPI